MINLHDYFHFQHSMVWTLTRLCRTPTLTLPGPVVLSLASRQELLSSPWQPTTSCLTISKQPNSKRFQSFHSMLIQIYNHPNIIEISLTKLAFFSCLYSLTSQNVLLEKFPLLSVTSLSSLKRPFSPMA